MSQKFVLFFLLNTFLQFREKISFNYDISLYSSNFKYVASWPYMVHALCTKELEFTGVCKRDVGFLPEFLYIRGAFNKVPDLLYRQLKWS